MTAPPPDRVRSFQQARTVSPAAVEQELTALWRQAVDSPGGGAGEQVTRACLWNLIVYDPRPEREGPGGAEQGKPLRTLLDQVTVAIPARILRLEAWAADRAPAPEREVEAWVAARCLLPDAGARQLAVEEITYAGYGPRGLSHFPSLVRATLLPDLPIAMLWLDDLPHEGWLLDQLLPLCQRVLIDSQAVHRDVELIAVDKLVNSAVTLFVDLGWMRLTPVRYLLAGLFDPPGRAEQLSDLRHVRIVTTQRGRNAGLLLLSWLLSRANYRAHVPLAPEGDDMLYRWRSRHGNAAVEVEFKVEAGEGGYDGVILAELNAGGDLFSIRHVDDEHVALHSPDRSEQKLALHGWREPELVIAGLGSHGIDRFYPQTLATAASLVEDTTWHR